MNLHEREKLTAFLQQLTQTQAGLKDADADTMIRGALARQPDAGYLLVQRAMQLEYLLQETKSQCSQLQADLDKARSTTPGSFVNAMNAWGMKPAGLPSATATATAVSAPGFGTQAHVPMRAPSAVGTSPWGGRNSRQCRDHRSRRRGRVFPVSRHPESDGASCAWRKVAGCPCVAAFGREPEHRQ